MDRVIESGSHSSDYGKEISYPIMGHRIDKVPFAEDPRGEQRGKSQNTPKDLVNAFEPKTSGLRNKLGLDVWNMHVPWKPDKARDDKRKDKRVERKPGQLQPLQIDLDHRIPELSDTGTVIQEPQSLGVPNALAAELEGYNAMPNYGRDLPGGDSVRQTVPWDVNSNSSTRAEANLALTDDMPNVPELPSNPAYRRPLPAPIELGGNSASSFVKQSSSDPSVELRRIQDEVVQAMMDYPELKGPGPKFETTTGSINRILMEYGRMKNTNNRTKREYSEHFVKTQDDLRATNTGLQSKLNARERELKGLKSKHEQELERLEREISSLKFQKRELESSHGNKLRKEKRSLQNEIDNLQSKLRKTQNDADSDMRDLEKRLGKAFKTIDDLKAQLVKEANGWQQHSNRLAEAKADLERRLQNAKSDEQERVDAVHAEWQDKLHQERREHEDSLRRLRSDIEQLKGDLRREESGHQEELRKQEEVLMNRYEARIKEKETVIEDFKSSSARREHFKGMTDSQVAAEYKRLASSIDEFSRVEWDRNKEHTWPISDDHMRKLAKNTRKLRQQIIQNTLWLLLYDHVFRSPFKILGTDGEQDDAEWIPIYSSGASSYEWPDISMEAERNRFETAKASLDAVEPSASHSTLKSSFEASVTNAMDVICHTLLKVTSIRAEDRKSLDSIIRLAGRVWLGSCSQRYRLIVILPHGSGDILSYVASNHDNLKLVVRPDLKRYGDSQGKGLMRGEPLASWKAQIETYPQ